jgi:Flp pilus assembly protein TadB
MMQPMFRSLFFLAGIGTTVGLVYWMGPLFLVASLALVVIAFLFSMTADPRNDQVRTPTPTSFHTSYFTKL